MGQKAICVYDFMSFRQIKIVKLRSLKGRRLNIKRNVIKMKRHKTTINLMRLKILDLSICVRIKSDDPGLYNDFKRDLDRWHYPSKPF